MQANQVSETRTPRSQNARTHGLTSTNPAATRAEKIQFNKLRKALLAELDPQSATEFLVAEQIILHRWFLAQCDAAEAACMRAAVHDFHHPPFTVTDAFNPTAGQLKYKLAQVNTPRSRADRNDHDLRLAYNAPELDKVHRYRKEHQRALDRALDEWKLLARNRPLSPVAPEPHTPNPKPGTPHPIPTKRKPEKSTPTLTQRNTYDLPNRPASPAKSAEPGAEPDVKQSNPDKNCSSTCLQPAPPHFRTPSAACAEGRKKRGAVFHERSYKPLC